MNFEKLPSNQQTLSFQYLEKKFKEHLGIQSLNSDMMKVLYLYDEQGYNNAAHILSDTNSFPGIDIALFGDSQFIIEKRQKYEHHSILEALEGIITFYQQHYSTNLVPENALREAIAQAIIQRDWTMKASIRIAVHLNRTEILIPYASTLENYLSTLSNPILANVFYRLGIARKISLGSNGLLKYYEDNATKPTCKKSNNVIQLTLPVIEETSH